PLRLSAMSSSWRIAIPPLPVPRAPLGFPSLRLHDTLLGPKSGYPQPGPIESHVGPHYGSLLPSVSSERHINSSPPPQNSCSVALVCRFRVAGDRRASVMPQTESAVAARG